MLTLLELLENAETNMKNIGKLFPFIKDHPIYIVGIQQLEEALNMVLKQEGVEGGEDG